MADNGYMPLRGERALLVGQTGSGKTTLATWLLQRLEHYPRIIIDTKIEPKFDRLPDHDVVETWKEASRVVNSKDPPRHVVLRPSLMTSQDPEALDDLLMQHYQSMRGMPVYIDEAYQYHVGGRAGPGLLALLTRGRSRGITTIVSTQRPAWLSRFCLTESQRFYVLRTIDRTDRKRISEVTPYPIELVPPKHYWGYWDSDLDNYVWFKPIHSEAMPYHDDVDGPTPRKWL